jgi:coproporphyrinogen III oxidase-like Fe-S oxidoreductase
MIANGTKTPYVVRLPNMGKHLYPPPLTKITPGEFAQLLDSEPRAAPRAHLYVHFPFCETICTFCVLQKMQLRPTSRVHDYITALKKELAALSRLPLVRGLRVNTVYFGGGTPSVIEDRYLAEVMDVITASFALDDAQITFEGHVLSLTRRKMHAMRRLGFNRISTGVQTFDPTLRRRLNLTPTEADIRRCEHDARAEGFDDFNIDLMYNLPGQTPTVWEGDLLKAVSLNPSGVDVYETVITRRTALGRQVERGQVPVEHDAHALSRSYLLAEDILSEHGYFQRNVHVWDRPGYENRLVGQQRLLRDQELTVIGAGLSAYSFVNSMPFVNVTRLNTYIDQVEDAGHGIDAFHATTRREDMERFMTLSLQTMDFDRRSFARLFGEEMDDVFERQLASFLRRGLIEPSDCGYRLTSLGRAWASTMTIEFFGPDVLEEFMQTRFQAADPPGYAADVSFEELFALVVFAIFHPELVFKGRPNLRLLREHARFARKVNRRWLRQLGALVWAGTRSFGPPPLHWYAGAGYKLLRGQAL